MKTIPDRVDADALYESSLKHFTEAIEKTLVTSHATANIDGGERLYCASVLYLRLCTFSVSILSLSPGSKMNPDGVHWDFASIASLTRNLFECALTFHYLAVEQLGDDEWRARLNVMQLHDCMSRYHMFRDFDPQDAQLPTFLTQAEELKAKLSANAYFQSLPEKVRPKLFRGEQANILTQDEILHCMGAEPGQWRGMYRFLSSHAHSFPLAYYRMAEHGRGHGFENYVDKGYMGGALENCAIILSTCTDAMRVLFDGKVAFPTTPPNWGAVRPSRATRRSAGKAAKRKR
jgi:Family of unknown function (DUF5677)